MPLFEYECKACGKVFEHLTREGETPVCEHCGEKKRVVKRLSTFATHAVEKAGAACAPGACGDQACEQFGCQSGMCGLN
ncbi:MAG: FmdB family zinc ribbon protein [Planctomycetota bacterium]